MTLEKKIPLNFTSQRFTEKGFFKVPKQYRNAEMFVCGECKNIQFGAEMPEKEETEKEQNI